MTVLKLAYRNLVGAGLKTWLKVAVLSFSYVLIIWHFGFFEGMYKQAMRAMADDEIGGGQYWHAGYDPYDPLSIDEGHGTIPPSLKALIEKKHAVPVLIAQGTIYPEGRVQSVLLKGIEPSQTVLNIPTGKLDEKGILPIMVGKRMAKNNSLKKGDYLTIRWRDVNGTFDAVEGKIVEVMNTSVGTIDNRQLWLPLGQLQKMLGMEDNATMVVIGRDVKERTSDAGWVFRGHDFLLKDLNDMVNSKKISARIMYFILLFLAMIAIFDTQILSIFRRKKEIGTLMAMGMTRPALIALFTLEGALIGVLAALVGAVYGTPLIYITGTKGIAFPEMVESFGFAISTKLYPAYSAGLVVSTVLIVMITTTIVSYLPSSKIAKMKPSETLKGKVS